MDNLITSVFYEIDNFCKKFIPYMEQQCIQNDNNPVSLKMLVNLINIAYCAMKVLPYQDETFSKYRTESVQEFRFVLSEQIRQQVFYAIFVEKVETSIKSNTLINVLKYLIQKQGYYL